MRYSSRIFLWAPLALLLALTAGVSARWWSVANDLSRWLDRVNGREVTPGVTMRFASKTVGGFPFRIDAVFRDFQLNAAGPRGPLAWRTENFAAHALTYGRSKWIFEAAGKQRLTWTSRAGKPHGLVFEIGSLHASAAIATGQLDRFDLDLVGFDSPALAIARLQFHVRRHPAADQIDVVAGSEEIQLSPRLRGVCGETIGYINVDGNFSNARAFDPALSGVSRWQDGFDNWHKRGGRFFLGQSELACGASSTFAQGQIALDDGRRPRGLITAQIAGFDRLRESAARSESTFVNALLRQSGEPNPAQEGRVTVRAAFRDGITYLGDTPAGINNPLY